MQSPGLAVFYWLYHTTSRLLPVTTRGVPFSGDIKLCLSLRDLPRKKASFFLEKKKITKADSKFLHPEASFSRGCEVLAR